MGLFNASSGGTMLYRGGYSTDSPVGVYDVETLTVLAGNILSLTIRVYAAAYHDSITTVGLTRAIDFLSEKIL
jgi:hypothetical protein